MELFPLRESPSKRLSRKVVKGVHHKCYHLLIFSGSLHRSGKDGGGDRIRRIRLGPTSMALLAFKEEG